MYSIDEGSGHERSDVFSYKMRFAVLGKSILVFFSGGNFVDSVTCASLLYC